jgi:hypothetical protein
MGFLHVGQCDGGMTMESFSGMRTMHTLRKLPTMLPKRKSTSRIKPSTIEAAETVDNIVYIPVMVFYTLF